MSRKNGFGKLLGLAAVVGAGAAVVSYLNKYHKFSEAVDEDFTDFVDDAAETKEATKRAYTSLHGSREDFKAAAKDLGTAAKNLAFDAANLAVDAGKDAYKAVKDAVDNRFAGKFEDEDDFLDEDFDDVLDGDFDEDEDVEVEFFDIEEEEPKKAAEAVGDAAEKTAEQTAKVIDETAEDVAQATETVEQEAKDTAAKTTATITEEL